MVTSLLPLETPTSVADIVQPSATGQNWEKYQKNYADDEIEEKKITPLTDEYGHLPWVGWLAGWRWVARADER